MGCKTSIQNLNRRITLEEPQLIQDDIGGSEKTWVLISKLWSKIEPKSASQVKFSEQLQHRVTHKITVRYFKSPSLKIDQRIIYDNRIFQIKGFRNLMEQNQFFEIDAEEGSAS